MLSTEYDHREFCEKLLILDARLDSANDAGDTALHLATQYGNMYLCQLYVDRFKKVAHGPQEEFYDGTNARNNRGYTPLMCAVEQGFDHIILYLLQNGADVQCLGLVDGESATSIAYQKGLGSHFNLWKRVCVYCNSGHTITSNHFICDVRQGNTDNVKAYLKQNMPVDTADEQGVTVLEMAAELGHLSVVQLLIKSGAGNVTQALARARGNNNDEVIAYLENR